MKLKLLKVTRTNVDVRYSTEVKTETGEEIQKFEAHDAPLQKFDDALQSLGKVAAKLLEAPPEWASDITVQSLTLSYTKNGTRSAQISFTKQLDSTTCQHPLTTPMFQIDDGAKGEDTRRQCTKGHAEAVEEMIAQAVKYAKGDRQQMQLGYDASAGESAKGRKGDAANGQKIMFPEGSQGAGESGG